MDPKGVLSGEYTNCSLQITRETFNYYIFWTWGTDLAIATICFAVFIILFWSPRRTSRPAEYLIPFYFCFTGDAYTISGISHMPELIDPTNVQVISLLQTTAYTVGSVASLLLLSLAMVLLGLTPRSTSALKRILFFVVLCCAFSVLIWEKWERVEVVSGLTIYPCLYFGILLILMIVYLVQICKEEKEKRWHYMIKAFATLIVLASLVYKVLFFPKCGSLQAYLNCYQECPLPPGEDMSQSAYLHDVVLMLGYMVWAWSEDGSPSIKQENYGHEGVVQDDATVISEGTFTNSEHGEQLGQEERMELLNQEESMEFGEVARA
jgi:hypothetical protein